ncbi:MAG: DNA mismatch repair protein MutS, partial [Promethearchaeota archaeon]
MATRSKTKKTTPMMQKWHEFKKEYPDAILFYQVGDFYETFYEDAQLVSKELGLTLTARGTKERTPLAGVPVRSIETYITRLVKKGYKVIQIDQTEDAKKAKGPIVARGITRIVTAGTAISGELVPDRANNYLIAIDEARGRAGLVIADISTGEFLATQLEASTKEEVRKQLLNELSRYRPSECVLPSSLHEDKVFCQQLKDYVEDMVLSPYDDRAFLFETAEHRLLEHFKTLSLDGFGCADRPLVVSAAGAALAYLQENQKEQLTNIQALRVYQVSEFMHLDATTERNLELVRNTRDSSQRGTLLAVLDHTVTNMGGRLLRRWILHPLLDVSEIQKRLDSVEELVDNTLLREEIRDHFDQVYDLQRLISRISYGSANARDVLAIKVSLEKANEIKNLLPNTQTLYLQEIYSGIENLSSLIELIDQAIVDDPPITIKEGGMIKRGYNAELDDLHEISSGGKKYLLQLEEREKQRTGIPSLKVGFNSVFGYYIEVTNTHKNKVPNHYVRKQTLTNRERYITDELKEFEEKILNAQDKIFELEYDLFNDIRTKIKDEIRAIQKNAELLATLDVLCTFAWIAPSYQYTKPKVNDSTVILIRNGRHPVVEAFQDEPFIPNDTLLDTDENQFLIITGPNMAGKCVTPETMVYSNQGILPIGKFKPNGIAEGTFEKLKIELVGKKGFVESSHFYSDGKKPTIRITTRRGYYIEGTYNHAIWVRTSNGEESWKKLKNVTDKDYIIINRHNNLWGSEIAINYNPPKYSSQTPIHPLPEYLNKDLAYLLGLLIGDGTLTYDNSFSLSTGDEFIKNEFIRINKSLFDYTPGIKKNKMDLFVTSQYLRDFLKFLGLGYHRAHEKYIPECILKAPEHIVKAFMQGLFDSDGYADKKYGNPDYSTASKKLALQVHQLLLNWGIVASHKVKKTKRRPSHQIRITGYDSIIFHEKIGFRLPRKSKRRKLASSLRMTNIDSIPYLFNILSIIK